MSSGKEICVVCKKLIKEDDEYIMNTLWKVGYVPIKQHKECYYKRRKQWLIGGLIALPIVIVCIVLIILLPMLLIK